MKGMYNFLRGPFTVISEKLILQILVLIILYTLYVVLVMSQLFGGDL